MTKRIKAIEEAAHNKPQTYVVTLAYPDGENYAEGDVRVAAVTMQDVVDTVTIWCANGNAPESVHDQDADDFYPGVKIISVKVEEFDDYGEDGADYTTVAYDDLEGTTYYDGDHHGIR